MSIDFSTYTIKELHEAWTSIDEEAYPSRAIELYERLNSAGEPLFEEELESVGILGGILQFFGGGLGSDIVLDNTLCRMKEERVKKMIELRRVSET
jgi:hypothetical protein